MSATPQPSRFRNWVRRRYRGGDQGFSKAQALVIAAAAMLLLVPLMFIPLFFAAGPAMYNTLHRGQKSDCDQGGKQPSESASAKDIPRSYLELYKKAGDKFGLPWNVLAGIGKEETNHGRSTLKGVHSGANYAGAGGPMQFLTATFDGYAVDGNHDGKKDRYEPADAIFSAAKYLKANGAPTKMWNAIWHYNQASWYIEDVLKYAKHYASGDFTVENDTPATCENAGVSGSSSATVKKVIQFARDQLKETYVLGATGPDAWDCSSLMQKAYASVGVTIPRVTFDQWPFGVKIKKGKEQPGDLVFFAGSDGTMSRPGHVGLVIGHGKMIEAPHTGAVVRVNSYKRTDLVGFTRPLAHKGAKPKV